MTLGRNLRLADLTSRRALGFGVTASLGADEDYAAGQAFAASALAAGYEGIRYLVRHDPAQRLYGLALFGPKGLATAFGEPATIVAPSDIPAELQQDTARGFGYRILPTP